MKLSLLIASLFFIQTNSLAQPGMSQQILENTVKKLANKSEGSQGFVKFKYNKLTMYLISDVKHDRMRIITPVSNYEDLTELQIFKVLESNFHKSLDARYAISKGILYSAYIHPLSTLTIKQIQSAVSQVSNLSITFGKQYSSGVLTYGKEKPVTKKPEVVNSI